MSIYAFKRNGKLTGQWRVEVQVNGRRCRGLFDSLEEARTAEANWTGGVPDGMVIREETSEPPVTLKQLYRETRGSLWRGKAYRETAETRCWRVITLLGVNTRIADVTTVRLDEVVKTFQDEGLKGATINKYLSNFHKLMEWGRVRKYVRDMPEFPREDEDEGRIRWMTRTEEQRLLKLLPEDVARMVRVALMTGMRRGEFYTIRPQDLEDRWLHIWITKTKASRSIPVSEATARDLEWLFTTGMPSMTRLRYYWDRAQAKMNLSNDPWFTFHVTRHTCATRLVQANVHLRTIQKWLGHKSIQTTLRYAQVNEYLLSDALSTLEKHLGVAVDKSPHLGYSVPTTVSGGSSDNPGNAPETIETARELGHVRGRGGIGIHAGFRFPENPEEPQDDNEK